MPTVLLARQLTHQCPAPPECKADGTTIAAVLDDLERQFPGIRHYLLDDQGKLRQHVNIFIGQQIVRDRQTLSDPVSDNDEIHILQALSGG